LRVDPDGHQGDIEFRAFAEGTVAFDYNGRAYRFGAKLAEDESRRLVDLLATA
jgi:hypothetical protein